MNNSIFKISYLFLFKRSDKTKTPFSWEKKTEQDKQESKSISSNFNIINTREKAKVFSP